MRGSPRLRLILVLLLLTAFTLTALDFRHDRTSPLAALRRGVQTIVGAVAGPVGGAVTSAGRVVGGLPRLGGYASANRRLQQENDRLRTQLRTTVPLRCEEQQWNALLRLRDYGSYHVVPAQVTSLGSAFGLEWTATIDAGTRDGIRPRMTVVNGLGLVGRTIDVGPRSATVLLVADPGFTVGSRLSATSSFGLATGRGLGPMTYQIVGTKPPVRAGDVLVTTGSDTFVPGVPLGTVGRVTPDANALTRSALVTPFVDVTALSLVGVVTEPPRTAPRGPLPTALARPAACLAASAAPTPARRAPAPGSRPTSAPAARAGAVATPAPAPTPAPGRTAAPGHTP